MNDTSGAIFAPAAYWNLTPEQRKRVCNRCGPSGVLGKLVPNTLWGLWVGDICDVHDYQYLIGETHADKESADRSFLYNLQRRIEAQDSWWWVKKLRHRRAKTYYEAVRMFGGPAFWAGKNLPEEMGN